MPDAKLEKLMEGYIFSHVRHKLGQKEREPATIRHYKT